MIKIVMDLETRTYSKSNHGNIPQNTRQLSNDIGDLSKPTDQSSSAETFCSNSDDNLKVQPNDLRQLRDLTLPFPEEDSVNFREPPVDSTVSYLQSHLSRNGSENDVQDLKLQYKVSRTEEYDLSSRELTDVTACAATVGGSDNVYGGARERLMLQIDSFLRDPELTALHYHRLPSEESQLKHTGDNVPEPNFKLEIGPEIPEMSATGIGYVTLPYKDASHKACQSQDVEKLSKVELLCNLVKADIFTEENESLKNFLILLHCLKDICCQNGYCEHESHGHVRLNMLQQNEDNRQISQEGLNVQDNQRSTSFVQTKVDDSEDSNQTTLEETKELMACILKVLRKNQFSSAVELAKFLEVIQQMKVEVDQWCSIQNRTRTASSKDREDPTALDCTSGGDRSSSDAITILRTKISQRLTDLSEGLVLWQDFIESRAELEHELTLERRLINSVQANISFNDTPRTELEAEHDLKLVEDQLEEYSDKLASLRKYNRQLAKIFDRSTLTSNQEQTGILANELQNIKGSCSELRSILNSTSGSGKIVSTPRLTSEKKNSFQASCSQMEKSAEEADKLPIASILLKMTLLLFLIVLLILFVDFFEPCWYRPLNRFRLPLPTHMRHVGTYPPM